VVWLAPVLIMVTGRSAVIAISGTRECQASITAGWRLPAAVPEVVITGTGVAEPFARPSAVKAALRSSIRTCSRSRPILSASKSS
jgi:hypothetical protein